MDRIQLKRNAPVAQLYEGAIISSSGAVIDFSGKKTGLLKSKMDEHTFEINRERVIDYLNTRDNWDPKYRIKVRVICARAYHALFMNIMLISLTEEELASFGKPDFIIYNASQFPQANRFTEGMSSTTSVEINFKRMEMVILGTEYAAREIRPTIHSSANVGIDKDDVTLFFSADPNRLLIGDDEHVWSDTEVFNTEGGCYAKCINLSSWKEPEIFNAIRFGSILENVVYNPATRTPDYDVTITEHTLRYPIEYIPNAKIPCMVDRHHHIDV
ncbi:hypothetical protein AZE42_07944 [Rhizopogon vesiculosus]|uniref:Phosphoenolpyruvate carboxykinase (ATP) n=1 Tax=Rhizopogon vesiculosus TaxID=180088 RepID=A0A1J8R3T7_9AGAM|nr:hypothetical protein AZE42_07944 [Rhizopogon vesiculosus]